jgi:hypothetical protein
MTLKKLFAASLVVTFATVVFLSGCKHTDNNLPLEPISIVMPDSPIVTAFDGNTVPIQLQFTADKPLNYILGVYDIDTTFDSTTYIPAYADTLFNQNLQNLTPRQNLYSWSGNFVVPDTLRPFSIIRFKFAFTAGSNGGTEGQNYSVGIDTATKQLIINIR